MLSRLLKACVISPFSKMLHQDLRPANVMIDQIQQPWKFIDFGSTACRIGLKWPRPRTRTQSVARRNTVAPSIFLRVKGTVRSDLFSLGPWFTYQMLTGKLAYGAKLAKTKTQVRARIQINLRIQFRYDAEKLPVWVDDAHYDRLLTLPDPYSSARSVTELFWP